MTNFFIIAIVVLILIDIALNVMNWNVKQELKEMKTEKKKKKPTKEQMKAYEVFCNALNRGVDIDFDGIKCKKVDKNLFLANGKVYELTIENFIKLLKGE
jgi:hypothetical protein